MAYIVVITANGYEAFFRHGTLIHSSTPEQENWSAAAEGAVSAAESGLRPTRLVLKHITGDMVPDWSEIRRDLILPDFEDIGPDNSDLMNLAHDDDGQYGM